MPTRSGLQGGHGASQSAEWVRLCMAPCTTLQGGLHPIRNFAVIAYDRVRDSHPKPERRSETGMASTANDERVGRMEFQLQMRQRGITDTAVLRALDEVPREYFVPADYTNKAYADHA